MTHPAGSCWRRRCCRQNLQHLLRFATCGIPQHKNWSLVGVNTCPWLKFKTQTYLNRTNCNYHLCSQYMTSTTKCDVTNNKVHSKVSCKTDGRAKPRKLSQASPTAFHYTPGLADLAMLELPAGLFASQNEHPHLVRLSRINLPRLKIFKCYNHTDCLFGFVCNSVAISLGPQFLSTS